MATSFQKPFVSPGFQPILGESGTQFEQFQTGAPSILSLYQNVPGLQVPGLDPTQLSTLNQLVSTGTSNTDLANARAQLEALTSGPIGSSPATQAGMEAFQQLVAPTLTQQSALRGTAGGGQAIEALGQGATEAALPLIQQEIQNREAGVGQSLQMGGLNMQELAMALEAAGLPREVALQQAEALNQQQQQQWQTGLGLQTFPMSLWGPSQIGTKSYSTPGAWDYVSGVGKGLSPSGLFGG